MFKKFFIAMVLVAITLIPNSAKAGDFLYEMVSCEDKCQAENNLSPSFMTYTYFKRKVTAVKSHVFENKNDNKIIIAVDLDNGDHLFFIMDEPFNGKGNLYYIKKSEENRSLDTIEPTPVEHISYGHPAYSDGNYNHIIVGDIMFKGKKNVGNIKIMIP